ncbi:efflux RND transporter periplasmic adaptor subunit [Sphingorhabdus arenilitoris]|uniref:Efflux RND transporter periplasmic adaptor subunit n=1 Tax=Sphingorhabdus arenilitoris TaxID=1490041 RepID=A0ABV8RKG6_9SPHN
MRTYKYHKLSVALALAPALLLGACNDKKAAAPTANAQADEILPVKVAIVQPSNLLRTIEAAGSVRHRRETPLGFTTAGKVSVVRYDVGDYIKRGALVAALDTTNVEGDLNVARAEQERANAEFGRVAQLYKDGWITKGRYEAADATRKAAEARVAQAGFATGTSRIYAPSSGVVLSRFAQPGQVIAAGSPAILMGQDDEGFDFRVAVVNSDAAKLRPGIAAMISLDGQDADPFQATISEIEGRADAATGAFIIHFRLPAKSGIRSGQIGKAAIKLPAADDGSLQIPASALFAVRTGEGLVYVVDPKSNIVQTRNVTIGALTDGFVMVKGGISAGEMIVVSGGEKLSRGMKVQPVRTAG